MQKASKDLAKDFFFQIEIIPFPTFLKVKFPQTNYLTLKPSKHRVVFAVIDINSVASFQSKKEYSYSDPFVLSGPPMILFIFIYFMIIKKYKNYKNNKSWSLELSFVVLNIRKSVDQNQQTDEDPGCVPPSGVRDTSPVSGPLRTLGWTIWTSAWVWIQWSCWFTVLHRIKEFIPSRRYSG